LFSGLAAVDTFVLDYNIISIAGMRVLVAIEYCSLMLQQIGEVVSTIPSEFRVTVKTLLISADYMKPSDSMWKLYRLVFYVSDL
jgi:hypothetical protein